MFQVARYLSFMIFMLSIQNHIQRGARSYILKKVRVVEVVMLQVARYLKFMIFLLSKHVQRGAGRHILKKFELERFLCCRLHNTSVL
jgi:hypothetical protein